jgi:hypothetical protein
MGLMVVAYLARQSVAKSLVMAVTGILLGCIGLDPITATPRFTFGMLELADGIGIAPVVMGLFGIAEVLENLGVERKTEVFAEKIKGLFPNREDWKRSAGPIARGSLLGFSLGLLPGVGAIVPQFLRGRRFAGGLQQRRGRRHLHPAPELGHTFYGDDGDFTRRAHDLWSHPRTFVDQEFSRSVLGRNREHVHRQPYALDPQSAADSLVGAGTENPLCLPFLLHHSLLSDRRLQPQQQHHRYLCRDRLQRSWTSHEEIRLRARAPGARIRIGPFARNRFKALANPIRRHPFDLSAAADLGSLHCIFHRCAHSAVV